MSVATIVITATRANAPATTIINRGPTGPAGPSGPAGADSITSATTSDGTADINFNQVGIGTTSPADKLHVSAGAIRLDNFYQLRWGGTGTGVFGHLSQGLNFYTNNGATRLKIENDGNVGIGTTSPSQKLDVQGTMLVNNEIQLVDSNMRIFRSSNDLRLRTGGGDRVTIKDAGNVGIGTTSPSYPLEIAQTGRGLGIKNYITSIDVADSILAGYDTGAVYLGYGYGSKQIHIGSTNSGNVRIRTSGNTIVDNGNVGIGTASPSQKLDVDGAVKKAVFTVNTLPTATAGTSCYVSDSNHTHHSNVGQVVASGGSNFVPVYYDGTDWRIG